MLNKVRILDVHFIREHRDQSFIVFDELASLFPSLEELKVYDMDKLEVALLPKSIRKLDLCFADIDDEHRDLDILLKIEQRLPFLEKLHMHFGANMDGLREPVQSLMKVTELNIALGFDQGNLFMRLDTWFKLFPRLHMGSFNLHVSDIPEDEVLVGDVDPETTLHLSYLQIDATEGPPICTVLNAFPNLTELCLDYRFGLARLPVIDYSTLPLGDFRKLTKLSMTAGAFGEEVLACRWFRQSFCTSYQSAQNKGVYVQYAESEFHCVDPQYMIPLWGAISEVLETFSIVKPDVDPSWLDVISSNLKVLELNCYFSSGSNGMNSDYERKWKNATLCLEGKGIKVEGSLKRFIIN